MQIYYIHEIPELHSYEKYGYKEDEIEGLKKWYTDYMMCKISNKKIGLSKDVYITKPIHDSCFVSTIDLTEEQFYEPENLIEHIKALIDKLKRHFVQGDVVLEI